MDKQNLIDLYNNEILTDCQLHLTDTTVSVVMNVHKNILYMACPYFKCMFTNFREQKSSIIKLEVRNARIASDIIKSFYGFCFEIPDWKYLTDAYIMKDFFQLDKLLDTVDRTVVPQHEFDDFIDTIDKIGYNEFFLTKIVKNIPENYDLEIFPLDLLNGLLSVCENYDIITIRDKGAYIWSTKYNKIILFYPDTNISNINSISNNCFYFCKKNEDLCLEPLFKMTISRVNDTCIPFIEEMGIKIEGSIWIHKRTNQLLMMTNIQTISVYDVDLKILIKRFNFEEKVVFFYVFEDVLLVFTIVDTIIINLMSGKIIKKFHKYLGSIVVYNSNINSFAYVTGSYIVCIFSLTSLSITNTIIHYNIMDMRFCDESNYFIIIDWHDTIWIYDINNNYNLVKTVNIKDIFGIKIKELIEFSSNTFIILTDYNDQVYIFDIETEKITQIMNCFEDDNKLRFIIKINNPEQKIFSKIHKIIQEKTQSKSSISS
ncbi:hypothetical protein QJ850_gp228 [Acanthamoeba polyphaga mimivirus]|uniref:BTB domain-containing protein n=1 Tax=Acanthamoeba polyphaga mimivirus Kroon TaxID=3069720 RepID=A0A0G2YBK0_9VIRU|nr:hypothetical protein QJ850_gp228 [Acanthamoeba polyphaga mimivirus]AKI80471.1 hypothetical protein [Acanthamoeba polyphaga mimivirus Kroon]